MSSKSYIRGHEIAWLDGRWIYCDTKTPTAGTYRDCGQCGKQSTEEGHDACLGTLKGIMNACCGHGQNQEAYVQFLDGTSIYGQDAITILSVLKKVDA